MAKPFHSDQSNSHFLLLLFFLSSSCGGNPCVPSLAICEEGNPEAMGGTSPTLFDTGTGPQCRRGWEKLAVRGIRISLLCKLVSTANTTVLFSFSCKYAPADDSPAPILEKVGLQHKLHCFDRCCVFAMLQISVKACYYPREQLQWLVGTGLS